MEGFNKLQELGSKTIASATHIPVTHIESILNKEFVKFQKPQFFGFLSILEREYKIDLSALKQEFLFTRAEEEITQDTSFDIAETSSKLFENKKALLENRKVIYGAAGGAVALLLVMLISMIDFSSTTEQKIEINNTAIDQAKKNLNLEPAHVSNVEDMMRNNEVESAEFGQDAQETNSSTLIDENVQEIKPVQEAKKAIDTLEPVSSTEPIMPLYLRLIPRGQLWVGIINAETHKRRAETITEPLILDAHKNWLIVTGYGHLDMDCGDTTNKYREDKKLLFLYENGICQVIDEEEFKARNRGKLW
ncbi:MAG: hypothetical protein WBF77_08950 [Sulfurimonadaceae bacterium]